MSLPEPTRWRQAVRRALRGVLAASLLLVGCSRNMYDQPRYDPLEASSFFADGRSARPSVAGTVARGQLRTDTHLYQGRVGGDFATTFPFPITRQVLERGRERFDIFCSPCHDRVGSGHGIVVLRGFKQPPSFHLDRLREAPPGYFFDVITRGFGTMYPYAERIPPADRWAIVAYVRALQLSQHASLTELSEQDREALNKVRADQDIGFGWPAPARTPER